MKKNTNTLSWIIIGALCFALLTYIAAFSMPYILTQAARKEYFDFSNTGEIGDTIGGITAPFIGIAGALLTFAAF